MLTTLYGRTTKIKLLSNDTDINNGAIYENVVASELKAHGFDLYYYNSKKNGEVDFVIENKGNILPKEVKSGKSYHRHSALSKIINIPNYSINEAFVLSNYNTSKIGNIVYYPIYMIMIIDKDVKLPKIELDDLSQNL